MANDKTITQTEELLLAASRMLEVSSESFFGEQLVVAAWQEFPDTFGLHGYTDKYPDSNRVYSQIMSAKKGLRLKGWLLALGDKRYRLTELGIQHAAQIEGTDTARSRHINAISKEHSDRFLNKMLESKARLKFSQGEELWFEDACRFWGFSPNTYDEVLFTRLAETDSVLGQYLKGLADGPMKVGNLTISHDQVYVLKDLHQLMLSKFDKELSYIRNRKMKHGKTGPAVK